MLAGLPLHLSEAKAERGQRSGWPGGLHQWGGEAPQGNQGVSVEWAAGCGRKDRQNGAAASQAASLPWSWGAAQEPKLGPNWDHILRPGPGLGCLLGEKLANPAET